MSAAEGNQNIDNKHFSPEVQTKMLRLFPKIKAARREGKCQQICYNTFYNACGWAGGDGLRPGDVRIVLSWNVKGLNLEHESSTTMLIFLLYELYPYILQSLEGFSLLHYIILHKLCLCFL